MWIELCKALPHFDFSSTMLYFSAAYKHFASNSDEVLLNGFSYKNPKTSIKRSRSTSSTLRFISLESNLWDVVYFNDKRFFVFTEIVTFERPNLTIRCNDGNENVSHRKI